MKRIKSIIASALIVAGVLALPVAPVYAQACDGKATDCLQIAVNEIGGQGQGGDELTEGIKTVVNVLLFILGAIAVVMIIIGGIRYTTSNGEASSIKSAKDTILYSVIGLVVAILAYAIVNFVIDAFAK